MWGKVSCLRKQHDGRDWALNHRPSDLKSNTLTHHHTPTCEGAKVLWLQQLNFDGRVSKSYWLKAGLTSVSLYPVVIKWIPK